MKNVVVIGASPKADRYSYLAHELLQQAGCQVIPVHPVEKEILGDPVYSELKEIWQGIHTVTVYVNASRFAMMVDDLIRMAPQRIIFNPGAEAPELYHEFPEHIEIVEACTLVMLRTNQF